MVIQGKYYLELFQSPSTNELEVMVHKSKERALKSRDECTINIIEVDIDELKHTPDVSCGGICEDYDEDCKEAKDHSTCWAWWKSAYRW
jgi:hypothetical protein